MSRLTFKALHKYLSPSWKTSYTGRPLLNLEKSLLLTIWKLSNGSSFRRISDRFNIGRGSTYDAFIRTVKLLYSKKNSIIRWPKSQIEEKQILEGFENLRNRPFPFVIGCVDGTHIPILTPKNDAASYYNRKGFSSILLQGVCDHRGRFIDIFFGFPGRCHDASVWKESQLGKDLEAGRIILPEGAHILGDSAYPLPTYLMVPFRDNGCLTEEEKRFNFIYSSTRIYMSTDAVFNDDGKQIQQEDNTNSSEEAKKKREEIKNLLSA